jgi:hypothetical protein
LADGRLDGVPKRRVHRPFGPGPQQAENEIAFVTLHDDLHRIAAIQIAQAFGGLGQLAVDLGQGSVEQSEADLDLMVAQGQVELGRSIRQRGLGAAGTSLSAKPSRRSACQFKDQGGLSAKQSARKSICRIGSYKSVRSARITMRLAEWDGMGPASARKLWRAGRDGTEDARGSRSQPKRCSVVLLATPARSWPGPQVRSTMTGRKLGNSVAMAAASSMGVEYWLWPFWAALVALPSIRSSAAGWMEEWRSIVMN